MFNPMKLASIFLAIVHHGRAITPGRLGLCLGNVLPNGAQKATADFLADLNAITNITAGAVKLVRTYGAGGTPPTAPAILEAAQQAGFQVLLGTWPIDETTWESEKTALKATYNYEEQVYGITVGSEGIYRFNTNQTGGYTNTQLTGWMADAIATFPNISVGTADTAYSYSNGSMDNAIKLAPRILLANAFPYWSEQHLGNSTANLFDQTLGALSHIQKIAGDPNKIHFMIGETGWPADGGSIYGNAIPNNINAQTYFNQAICPALKHGIDVFMFEAFDEPGKTSVVLPNPNGAGSVTIAETAWGVMDVDRILRLNLTCPDL